MIAFWICVLRILMHHPTFIGNRKQSMSAKRRSNTFKAAWTNAVTSLPLLFHVTERLKMTRKLYYNTLQKVSPRNQESYSETT